MLALIFSILDCFSLFNCFSKISSSYFFEQLQLQDSWEKQKKQEGEVAMGREYMSKLISTLHFRAKSSHIIQKRVIFLMYHSLTSLIKIQRHYCQFLLPVCTLNNCSKSETLKFTFSLILHETKSLYLLHGWLVMIYTLWLKN